MHCITVSCCAPNVNIFSSSGHGESEEDARCMTNQTEKNIFSITIAGAIRNYSNTRVQIYKNESNDTESKTIRIVAREHNFFFY